MIVHDLNIFWTIIGPAKYDPPLIVDSDRMLARKLAFQGFQLIAGRCCQVGEPDRVVNLDEFAPRHLREVGREPLRNTPLVMDRLSKFTFEALDHKSLRIAP